MIRTYSIPLFPQVMEPEDYARGWLEDCLTRCRCDFCVDDYTLSIEENVEGFKRAVFILKENIK